jgi:hypothetical protein
LILGVLALVDAAEFRRAHVIRHDWRRLRRLAHLATRHHTAAACTDRMLDSGALGAAVNWYRAGARADILLDSPT